MADPIFLGLTAFALSNTRAWLTSVTKAFIPFEDTVGQRSDVDKFQESTYGRPIPFIYGPYNRIAGNVIYFTPIVETENKIKHTNGTFGSSTYTIWYTYNCPAVAIAVGGQCRNIKRIWANGKLIWNNDQITDIPDAGWSYNPEGQIFSGIYLYNGSETQNRSPAITDTTKPGYRGVSYVVLENLQVGDFGNAIPNLEFEVDGFVWDVYNLITDICYRSGFAPDEFEVDPTLTTNVMGYVISRQSSGIDAIKSLAEVYNFDIVEGADKIYFKSRAKTLNGAIDNDSMSASTSLMSESQPICKRLPDRQFPKKVSVTYIDVYRDYQKSTQYSERTFGDSRTKADRKFEITLESETARKIADRLLWEPWTERLEIKFDVTYRHDYLEAGDYVGIKIGEAWIPFRIESKKRGANGIISFECTSSEPDVYDGSEIAEEATPADNTQLGESELRIYMFNPPLLENGQPESASWVGNASVGVWRGGKLYRSTDGGDTYYDSGTITTRNVTGVVTSLIPNANKFFWDRETVITVVLDSTNHELVSTSELNVLNGLNRIWVGSANGERGEIIGFTTAVLTSATPRTYNISGLIRGLRGTEHAMGDHAVNDIFVYLSNQIIQTFNYGYFDIGQTWLYKSVPTYFTETEIIDTITFRNTGERSKPRSPVNAKGERDSSNNLTITWMRRTRLVPPGIGYGPVILDEEYEQYNVEIYNAANTVLLRTIVASTQTASYTAAQQTTDGLTPGDFINIRIYQISPNIGRGHVGVFIV